MTTITFKVNEEEARRLRLAARREQTTVSEYLRKQIRLRAVEEDPIRRVKCRYTGAMIFKPTTDASKLTTEDVKGYLKDFP